MESENTTQNDQNCTYVSETKENREPEEIESIDNIMMALTKDKARDNLLILEEEQDFSEYL